MGAKRTGGGKWPCVCVAVLIFLSLSACGLERIVGTKMIDVSGEQASEHMARGRMLFARENYRGALNEIEKVFTLAGRNAPVDEALFYVGLIHAAPANPERNREKSRAALNRLVKERPKSLLVAPSNTLLALLARNEELEGEAAAAKETNDSLNRKVAGLADVADQLRQADLRGDQQMAKQTKTIEGLAQENEKLKRTVEELNHIINELKKVDIGIDQKKREQAQ